MLTLIDATPVWGTGRYAASRFYFTVSEGLISNLSTKSKPGFYTAMFKFCEDRPLGPLVGDKITLDNNTTIVPMVIQ